MQAPLPISVSLGIRALLKLAHSIITGGGAYVTMTFLQMRNPMSSISVRISDTANGDVSIDFDRYLELSQWSWDEVEKDYTIRKITLDSDKLDQLIKTLEIIKQLP